MHWYIGSCPISCVIDGFGDQSCGSRWRRTTSTRTPAGLVDFAHSSAIIVISHYVINIHLITQMLFFKGKKSRQTWPFQGYHCHKIWFRNVIIWHQSLAGSVHEWMGRSTTFCPYFTRFQDRAADVKGCHHVWFVLMRLLDLATLRQTDPRCAKNRLVVV